MDAGFAELIVRRACRLLFICTVVAVWLGVFLGYLIWGKG